MMQTNAKTQHLVNNNSAKFTHMSNHDLGHLIIKGRPGSERSKNAILELARRHRVLKNELVYFLDIFPQHSEAMLSQLHNDTLPNNLVGASDVSATPRTIPQRYNSLSLGILIGIFISALVGLYSASSNSIIYLMNAIAFTGSVILVLFLIVAIIKLSKD